MDIFDRAQKWDPLSAEKGIIVAAEISQEWLLPWWWDNYSRYNRYPVLFVDLGLSLFAKQWCEQRGKVIALCIPNSFVLPRKEIDPHLASSWIGGRSEKFWEERIAWFKKPFACLRSPFHKTVWMDLDCQVRSHLDCLFEACEHASGLAMVRYTESGSRIGLWQGGALNLEQAKPTSGPQKMHHFLGRSLQPNLNGQLEAQSRPFTAELAEQSVHCGKELATPLRSGETPPFTEEFFNKLGDAGSFKFNGCPTPPEPILESRAVYTDLPLFNSGVIAYKRHSPLIEAWARESVERNHLFYGDQELLSALISEQNQTICELEPIWNWSRAWGEKGDARIYHWHGNPGKLAIYKMVEQG